MEISKILFSHRQPAELTLPQKNLDTAPSFYHQFSFSKSSVEIYGALKYLQTFPPFQIATLQFIVGTSYELHELIMKNMEEVLISKNSEEKALVFIHFIRCVNRCQQEANLCNYSNTSEMLERIRLIARLKSLIEKLNGLGYFVKIDLSGKNLNYLNFTGLNLHLHEANFDGATVVKTNFTDVDLSCSSFENVDTSTAVGINFSLITGSPPSSCSRSHMVEISDEQQDVNPKATREKCIIM